MSLLNYVEANKIELGTERVISFVYNYGGGLSRCEEGWCYGHGVPLLDGGDEFRQEARHLVDYDEYVYEIRWHDRVSRIIHSMKPDWFCVPCLEEARVRYPSLFRNWLDEICGQPQRKRVVVAGKDFVSKYIR